MKKNMGLADRVIRSVLAILVAVLYFTHQISGTLALILGIFAVIFLITSMVSYCPAYGPLGFSTCGREEEPTPPKA